MHLLLIRHAESTDNVAALYGGSRDAPLTAHGVLQTKRLASHLVQSGLDLRRIFSSPLQRAAKTAQAICDARGGEDLLVTPRAELREKHFGNWEGVKYAASARRPSQTGAESSDDVKIRAELFLKQLWPVVAETLDADSERACVVVVSHGILLSALTKMLAQRLARGSFLDATFVQLSARVSWSNTGYLDIILSRKPVASESACPEPWHALHGRIARVNCVNHLNGLRKTRGGIGSAPHDDKQKTLEFFGAVSQKRKADDATK